MCSAGTYVTLSPRKTYAKLPRTHKYTRLIHKGYKIPKKLFLHTQETFCNIVPLSYPYNANTEK